MGLGGGLADLAVDVRASPNPKERTVTSSPATSSIPTTVPLTPSGAPTLGNADVNSIDHLRRAFAVGYPDDYAAIAQRSENHIVQPMMVGTAATYRAADGLRSQRRAKTFETQRINLN